MCLYYQLLSFYLISQPTQIFPFLFPRVIFLFPRRRWRRSYLSVSSPHNVPICHQRITLPTPHHTIPPFSSFPYFLITRWLQVLTHYYMSEREGVGEGRTARLASDIMKVGMGGGRKKTEKLIRPGRARRGGGERRNEEK